jgi:hypothetical protein
MRIKARCGLTGGATVTGVNAVVVLLAALLAMVAAPAPGARAAPPPPAAAHVVVVGVAGLAWSDVTPAGTPTLAALVGSGSAGTLSVRSAADVTCPAEGWLSLGAGGYAAAADPAGLDPSGQCPAGRLPPPVGRTAPAVPGMPELYRLNTGLRFGAQPGTLGDLLPCATAVGPGAALAAADPEGRVDHYQPALPAAPGELLARCPVTVVDLGAIETRQDLRSFDQALGRVQRSLPAGSVLLVLGVAETQARQPRLHVAVASGPGFGPGWLRSPSTLRTPYLQLVDIAPTVLSVLGSDVPDHLTGRPLSGGAAGRPDDVTSAVASLADADTQAVAQRAALGRFFAGFGAVLALVVAGAVWLLRRRALPGAARWLSVVALVLSAVPAATFLANLVPWWRSSSPLLALSVSVAVGALAMVAVAILAGHWFRDWTTRIRIRLSALAAMTLLVFVLDGVTGARLQLSSLLGYNPLVAGRFIGFGNIAFAVYAVAGVLLAACLAYGRRQAVAWGGLAAVAVPVIVFDGLPWWGADFGGVLTLVPTFVILGLLLARARITWRRLVVATGAGVAVVLAISWLDYLRPVSQRSHFGRFLASIMDGSAAQTIERKLLTNLDLLVLGPHTVVAALLIVAGVVLLIRPPAALRRVYRTWPVMRTGLMTVLVLAGFGFATNDSGIAIPTVMALVVLPMVVALCLWAALGDPWHEPPPPTPPRPTPPGPLHPARSMLTTG